MPHKLYDQTTKAEETKHEEAHEEAPSPPTRRDSSNSSHRHKTRMKQKKKMIIRGGSKKLDTLHLLEPLLMIMWQCMYLAKNTGYISSTPVTLYNNERETTTQAGEIGGSRQMRYAFSGYVTVTMNLWPRRGRELCRRTFEDESK